MINKGSYNDYSFTIVNGNTLQHESLHKLIMQGFVEGKRKQG